MPKSLRSRIMLAFAAVALLLTVATFLCGLYARHVDAEKVLAWRLEAVAAGLSTLWGLPDELATEQLSRISRELELNIVLINNLGDGRRYGRNGAVEEFYSSDLQRVPKGFVSYTAPAMIGGAQVGSVRLEARLDPVSYLLPALKDAFTTALIMTLLSALFDYAVRMVLKPLARIKLRTPHASGSEAEDLERSFNILMGEVEGSRQMQGAFVANVSHELKSPLASILGFVQGVLDGTIPPTEQAKYLTIVLNEARRSNKLITELLELSRMDAGHFPINKHRFELCELVRRVVIKFYPAFQVKKLELDVQMERDTVYVMADMDRIEQVLTNLVDNAVKFSPAGSEVRIWIVSMGSRECVTVSNSGANIPDKDAAFIWQRFYRVDKAHTPGDGTGLGLAIVKGIIDAHGQDIWAKSEGGEVAFSFTIDRA